MEHLRWIALPFFSFCFPLCLRCNESGLYTTLIPIDVFERSGLVGLGWWTLEINQSIGRSVGGDAFFCDGWEGFSIKRAEAAAAIARLLRMAYIIDDIDANHKLMKCVLV